MHSKPTTSLNDWYLFSQHFLNAGPNLAGRPAQAGAQCPLWDDTSVRHDQEVNTALRTATEALDPTATLSAADLAALRAGAVAREC